MTYNNVKIIIYQNVIINREYINTIESPPSTASTKY